MHRAIESWNLAEDASETVANRIMEQFELRPSDDEFDAVCGVLDALLSGDVDSGAVCRAIVEAKLSGEVASALLLVLLREEFSALRERVGRAASVERLFAGSGGGAGA